MTEREGPGPNHLCRGDAPTLPLTLPSIQNSISQDIERVLLNILLVPPPKAAPVSWADNSSGLLEKSSFRPSSLGLPSCPGQSLPMI